MGRLNLEDTQFFRAIGEERLAQVRPYLQLRSFRPGEHFYFEGQPAGYLWVVSEGEVRTLKTSPGGRVTMLERLRPGEIFGLAVVTQSPSYTEAAQALVYGEVWRAPRRIVSTLMEQEPAIGVELLGIVAARLQAAHDRLCSFAYDSVAARLANVVLEEVNGDRIQMTRRALGEAVGTTVETTIRVLRHFEREGWIEGGVGWIRIRDRAALQLVARGKEPGS